MAYFLVDLFLPPFIRIGKYIAAVVYRAVLLVVEKAFGVSRAQGLSEFATSMVSISLSMFRHVLRLS